MISKNDGDVTNYAYDVWGNMTSAGGATYAYNAQGLRVSKTVNGVTDNFVLVGGDVWADAESKYLRGLELISSDDYFYLYNIRGDVIQLLNYSGEVVKTYDYDAYGNELSRDLADENPFRYCGEYYDTETGLVYLRARYYDPSVGRFTSVDPAKDGLNWYAYCAANPVLYADKNGLFLDVVFDLVSLGFSIYDVIKNPDDIWAWAGLVGDVIDLAIPLAGGVGELIKGARAVETVTDAVKVADNAIDTADSLTDAIRTADKVADAADGINDVIRTGEKVSDTVDTITDTSKAVDKTTEVAKNSSKADILAKNREQGKAFEQEVFDKFKSNNTDAVEQITIKTESGTRTRVDAIGKDSSGNIVISEAKSSATARLTPNQKVAFAEIASSGGVVVGKGKGIFTGGYHIPAGTKIMIVRP